MGAHALDYKACHSHTDSFLNKMLLRGNGIHDIADILDIFATMVLTGLVGNRTMPSPKQKHDDCLEIDEFWTDVQKKGKKLWLLDAYHRETGEMVA